MGQALSCIAGPTTTPALSKKADLATLVESVKQDPKLLGAACLRGRDTLMHVLARQGNTSLLNEVLHALDLAQDAMLPCHSPGCISASSRHHHPPALDCHTAGSTATSSSSSSQSSSNTPPQNTPPCELCKDLCSQCRGRPALPEKWQLANLLNARRQTPLLIAAAQGHADVVRILLSLGADPMAVDKTDGCTALHYASLYGHVQCVQLLLESAVQQADGQGADAQPEQASRQASSAADQAATTGDNTNTLNVSRLVNHVSLTGATALHLASDAGHVDVVRLLCAHGADINAVLCPQGFRWFVVHQGATPLHLAAEQGHMGVALALLKHFRDHEADTPGLVDPRTQQDRAGLRPHQLAFLSHHFRVARVIRPSFPLTWLFDTQTTATKTAVPSLSELAARAVMAQLCAQLDQMAGQGATPAAQELHGLHQLATAHLHTSHQGASVSACAAATAATVVVQPAGEVEAEVGHSWDSDSNADGPVCDVCFEGAQCVRLQPCDHVLCVGCARRVCGSIVDKPAPCPFCRGHITGFKW